MTPFIRHYLETALGSSMDDDCEGSPFDRHYNINALAPEAIAQATSDCEAFQADNATDLALASDEEQNGHDFWLTRNRHGAGFWDRGYGDVGDRLTTAAHVWGEVSIYADADGVLRFE